MPEIGFEILHLPDFRGMMAAIHSLEGIQPDFAPLASELERVFTSENEQARIRGEDRFGSYLQEVTNETKKRTGRGPGPPLAPNLNASRTITKYSVQVTAGPEGIRVQSGWSGIPWLRYHADGSGRLPVRDIIGVSDESHMFVLDVIDEWIRLRVDEPVREVMARMYLTQEQAQAVGRFGTWTGTTSTMAG